MINQTPGAITLNANKIDLTGITTVSETLNIGSSYMDNTRKEILFRGSGGGVGIGSYGLDWLTVFALSSLKLDTDYMTMQARRITFQPYSTNGLMEMRRLEKP